MLLSELAGKNAFQKHCSSPVESFCGHSGAGRTCDMFKEGGWLLLVLVLRVFGREIGNSTLGWSEGGGGWVEHRDVCVEVCRCDDQAVNCSW